MPPLGRYFPRLLKSRKGRRVYCGPQTERTPDPAGCFPCKTPVFRGPPEGAMIAIVDPQPPNAVMEAKVTPRCGSTCSCRESPTRVCGGGGRAPGGRSCSAALPSDSGPMGCSSRVCSSATPSRRSAYNSWSGTIERKCLSTISSVSRTAFVLGARCNSWRPHGRDRDQRPRVEDDRWHTNASRRVLRHRGRWQMSTGGGTGRARSEGRRGVDPAARRAGTRCPIASEPSSGPRTAAGRPHERCLPREPPAPENARQRPRNREQARNQV
jgi:hypothetical protein